MPPGARAAGAPATGRGGRAPGPVADAHRCADPGSGARTGADPRRSRPYHPPRRAPPARTLGGQSPLPPPQDASRRGPLLERQARLDDADLRPTHRQRHLRRHAGHPAPGSRRRVRCADRVRAPCRDSRRQAAAGAAGGSRPGAGGVRGNRAAKAAEAAARAAELAADGEAIDEAETDAERASADGATILEPLGAGALDR